MKRKKPDTKVHNWVKEVEWHLYNYKVHKQLVERYKERHNDITLNGGGFSICPQKSKGKASPTERQALLLAELGEKVEEINWYVQAIDDILPLINDEEKYILEKRYFAAKPKAVWQISGDIFISRTEYYRRRNSLLGKFARSFGALL